MTFLSSTGVDRASAAIDEHQILAKTQALTQQNEGNLKSAIYVKGSQL